jgi:hypothetical protein
VVPPGKGRLPLSEALTPIENHPAVASLIEDLQGDADASLATSTRRACAADLRAFRDWCARAQRAMLPASPETVMLYVAELARTPVRDGKRRSVASVKRALSAICETVGGARDRALLLLGFAGGVDGRNSRRSTSRTWRSSTAAWS